MSRSKSRKRYVTYKRNIDQVWSGHDSVYRVTGDFCYVCRAGERFPESIAIREGVLIAPKNSSVISVGEKPTIEELPMAKYQEVFEALVMTNWYSSLLRGDAEARIQSLLKKIAERSNRVAPDEVVVQISNSHLATLCRLSREMVGRVLMRSEKFSRYPGVSRGILLKEVNSVQTSMPNLPRGATAASL